MNLPEGYKEIKIIDENGEPLKGVLIEKGIKVSYVGFKDVFIEDIRVKNGMTITLHKNKPQLVTNKIKDVTKGHLAEVAQKIGVGSKSGAALSRSRLEHCNKCSLLTNTLVGPICDKNKESDHIETGLPIKGCGCRLKAKTLLEDQKCPLGKW